MTTKRKYGDKNTKLKKKYANGSDTVYVLSGAAKKLIPKTSHCPRRKWRLNINITVFNDFSECKEIHTLRKEHLKTTCPRIHSEKEAVTGGGVNFVAYPSGHIMA